VASAEFVGCASHQDRHVISTAVCAAEEEDTMTRVPLSREQA